MIKVVIKNVRGITHRQFLNAIEKDSVRESFSGIWVDLENKCFVGADGHLLVKYPLKIMSIEGISDMSKFKRILPLDLFKITQHKATKKNFSEIEYVMFENHVEVNYKNFSCTMDYVTFNFPNYPHTIPNELTAKQGIDRIRVGNMSLKKLTRAFPDIRYDIELFADNKAILFKEHVIEDDVEPIIGILMPFSRNN